MVEIQGLNIAVIGATGAVGKQMIKTLESRNLPIKKLLLLSSARSAGKKLPLRIKNTLFRKQNLKALKE